MLPHIDYHDLPRSLQRLMARPAADEPAALPRRRS